MQIFVVLIVLALVTIACSLRLSNLSGLEGRSRRLDVSMMFGKPKTTSSKIVIKVDGKTIESSEKTVNLRRILIDNNIEVYPLKAKILGNCGGAGVCGTCAVRVIDGATNFNPPSKNELNTLNGKPADIRLSCCSKISGPITIKTKP